MSAPHFSAAAQTRLDGGLRTLARATEEVARYCDHTEHAERADRAAVTRAARLLIGESCALAEVFDVDIHAAYAARLASIEGINVVQDTGYDGGAAAREAGGWRALQLVQLHHDRCYHPDILGLSRLEQLRHCSLHMSKLVGCMARVLDEVPGAHHDFVTRRLPDMLLFGLKIATLMGEPLPDDPVVDRSFAVGDGTFRGVELGETLPGQVDPSA